MNKLMITTVQPDAEGRIDLGELVKGIRSFRVSLDANRRIILEPEDIPEQEKWLYENPDVLEGITRGIEDAKAGRVSLAKEDFTPYMDEEE